jgi:hypothetical protein
MGSVLYSRGMFEHHAPHNLPPISYSFRKQLESRFVVVSSILNYGELQSGLARPISYPSLTASESG